MIRGISSAGRALEWHSRGQRFDPAMLHNIFIAGVTQLVESLVANEIVAGSNPVSRSLDRQLIHCRFFYLTRNLGRGARNLMFDFLFDIY